MNEIKILIVENENDDFELYEDAIEDFNSKYEGTHKILFDHRKNREEAISLIQKSYYDAVFVDLDLDPDPNEESLGDKEIQPTEEKTSEADETQRPNEEEPILSEGNDIVEYIFNNMRYPVFVYTGKSNDDIENKAKANTFISVAIKAETKTIELLEDAKEIYDTGITKVLGSNGKLKDFVHTIFWDHLSNTLDHWVSIKAENSNIEKMISRYTLSHLYQYMIEKDTTQEKMFYDSAETYIHPPIRKEPFPGHIVQKKGTDKYYLLITPACTIANKAKVLQYIEIVDLYLEKNIENAKKGYFKELEKLTELRKEQESLGVDDFENKEKNQKEEIYKKELKMKNLLESFISNNKGLEYHYLPSFLDFKHKLIDFRNIETYSKGDFETIFEQPKMTVTVRFFKDIQARFSAYYARQGSPDFDKSEISNKIMDELLY